ncbi:hypothetical protein GCM10022215_23760 [Nocardioides fonticola]|uniref:4Fe-4S ferredoxin-type domain-containing protein n=1 Tax=Nocardioides fonticola TaxID=450363 RepID=A0ABP7XJK9_9ACTN
MHVEIDWTRCDGHGLCARLAPEMIELAEDGFPIVRRGQVPDAAVVHLKRAATACPQLALRLVKD